MSSLIGQHQLKTVKLGVSSASKYHLVSVLQANNTDGHGQHHHDGQARMARPG